MRIVASVTTSLLLLHFLKQKIRRMRKFEMSIICFQKESSATEVMQLEQHME